MRRLSAAGIVAVLLLASSSQGEEGEKRFVFMTGNALVEACAEPDLTCLGYVTGVADAVTALEGFGVLRKGAYCMPGNVSQGQLAAIFSKYLQENPAERHYAAASTLLGALAIAFPCATGAGKK
jgi:hypothetical protein